MRVERADGRKGARGRAADAGITMDDQRRATVPPADKIQHLLDVSRRGSDETFHHFGDVVDRDFEMVGLEHGMRPLHLIDLGHHRQDMAGAGRLDGIGEGGERTNVNHGVPVGCVDYRAASRRAEAAACSTLHMIVTGTMLQTAPGTASRLWPRSRASGYPARSLSARGGLWT